VQAQDQAYGCHKLPFDCNSGGTSGLIRGLFGSRNLDPVQRQLVGQCLKEKGYEVIGWQ